MTARAIWDDDEPSPGWTATIRQSGQVGLGRMSNSVCSMSRPSMTAANRIRTEDIQERELEDLAADDCYPSISGSWSAILNRHRPPVAPPSHRFRATGPGYDRTRLGRFLGQAVAAKISPVAPVLEELHGVRCGASAY